MNRAFAALLLLGLIFAATRCDGDSDDTAPAGAGGSAGSISLDDAAVCPETCACAPSKTCAYDCPAGGCKLECFGRCAADCSGGNCELDCDLESTCDYVCSGGGCSFDCDQKSICNISCPVGGCNVSCDGESTCNVDCGGGECVIDCQPGSQCNCTGQC